MSTTWFIRHAETEMAGRFCGHSTPDLNAKGRAQLTALADLLSAESIESVYAVTCDAPEAQRRRLHPPGIFR